MTCYLSFFLRQILQTGLLDPRSAKYLTVRRHCAITIKHVLIKCSYFSAECSTYQSSFNLTALISKDFKSTCLFIGYLCLTSYLIVVLLYCYLFLFDIWLFTTFYICIGLSVCWLSLKCCCWPFTPFFCCVLFSKTN